MGVRLTGTGAYCFYRPPYMRDGSVATLADVIDFYDHGGIENASLDREVAPLKLSVREKQALQAFLAALSGASRD
jgi:cytochrome c peroxidase